MVRTLVSPRPIFSFEYVGLLLARFIRGRGFECLYVPLTASNILRIRRPVDMVIAVGNINDSFVSRLILLERFKARRLVYGVVEGPYIGLLKNVLNFFTVIAPSKYVMRELMGSGVRVHDVIPHGINVKEFLEVESGYMNYESSRREVILLTISSALFRKGLHYYLQALKDLIRNNVGNFKAIIKTDASLELPPSLQEHVHIITGHLKRDELMKLYAIADVVVVPSLAEGFGLPIIEAFAAGKPVISLDTPPMNELNSNETGWLVKVERQVVVRPWRFTYHRLNIPDLRDFVRVLSEAIESEYERRRKAANAKRIRWHYHYEYVYKRFLPWIL